MITLLITVQCDNDCVYGCFEEITSKQCQFEENLGLFRLSKACTVEDVEVLFRYCTNVPVVEAGSVVTDSFGSGYDSIKHFSSYFIEPNSMITQHLSHLTYPPAYESTSNATGMPPNITQILGLFMVSLDSITVQLLNRYELIPIGRKNVVILRSGENPDTKAKPNTETKTVSPTSIQDACTFVGSAIYPPVSEQEEDVRHSMLLSLRNKLYIHVDAKKESDSTGSVNRV